MKTLYTMHKTVLVIILVCLTAFSGNAWGADYTCSFTTLTEGDNISSYTASHTHTAGGVTWTVYGNQSLNESDIRVGGKNTTATNRTLTSGQIPIAVKKFTINHLGTGNGKSSEITINSIKLEVANNSSFTSADVITKNNPSVSSSGLLDYTPTTGTSWAANSYYRVTVNYQITGTNNCYIKISSFVCTEYAVPHTVTFNAQGGTCATSSLEEASARAGVTLPAASPSTSCTAEGWGFYGWATAQCSSSTTTAPTIVGKAGDTYYPSTDITLHAVYAKGEYTKETSAITAGGKYLIVANSGGSNYIMTNTYSTYEVEDDEYGQLAGKQIDETNTTNHTYSAVDISPNYVFTIVTASSVEVNTGDWMIENVVDENYLSVDYEDIYLSYASMSSGRDGNTITLGEGGTWQIENAYNSGANKLYYDASENQFQSNSTASNLLLYKETITPTYYSNPTCCEDDPTIGGTAQLKTSGTFSLGQVDVECTSATVQSNCEWTDYGFIWSESVNTTATLQLNSDGSAPSGVTKVQVGTSGDASSFNGSLEKSSFETGHTYYYRAYVKNCYYDGSYVYSNTSTLASFTPYTISYNNNGESGTIDTKVVNTGGSVTLSDGTGFTKDHYHIDHWALNSAEGASHAKGSTYSSITANATFYAIWAINTHTFIWSFNGGSSSETAGEDYTDDNDEMEYGATITYPSSSSMSKTGYTFTGWSTTTTTMPDEDLDISANWSAVNYDVTYHLNGGTGVLDRTYTIETATFSLATPTKEGYQFAGWYANSDLSTGGVQTQITVGSTGDKEYWAKWTANTYKVQFNANGGTGSMSDQNFTYDAPKKALSANTFTPATGKYFAGWSTTSSGDVEYTDKQSVNNLTTTNSATVKLYAVWADHTYTNYRTNCVERYDITLDDGEVATTYNGSAKVKENGTTLVKLVAPMKTGYTLTGYYTAKSGGVLIADKDGNLKENVTVSTDDWTDGDGKWVLGDGATFYAYWSAKTYTITLDAVGGSSGSESVTLTYKSGSHDGITNPTKTGYDFGGWYSGVGGTGTLVINSSGTLQNSVTIETIGWTDASGNWILDGTATLYAKWTEKTTTVSFNQNSGTGGQTSNLTATYAATMPAISGTPTRAGYYFGGYYDGEGGTGTQYYTAAGASARSWDKDNASLTLYARWYGDLKAWCDPDNISITGDVHLTSYKDIYVNSTAAAGNLINFSCSELGSATAIEVAYLNADAADAEVAKESSLFRLCDGSDYSAADNIDIAASRALDKNFSIKYQPSTFNQLDNYKLQLKLKNGDLVLKTITSDAILHGRALPEEFVIAVKNGDTWVALPNDLATTLGDQSDIAPTAIVVDNATTPTQADYAPANAVYKVIAKKNDGHRSSIRLTATGSNYLRGSSTADNSKLCLSTSNYDDEDWYLKSSNLSVYEIAFDPTTVPAKKMGLYTKSTRTYMGYSSTQTNANIYLLPIETKYAVIEASPTDWSKNALAVTAEEAGEATQVEGRIEDGTPTSKVTLSSEGSDHTAEFSKDEVDFSGKEGQNLLLLWYNGSGELVGGSQITIPRIMSATGTEESWADFAVTPTINDIVVLKKPITITGNAQAKKVVIDQSEGNTGKLVIEAGKSLVVAEKVIVNNGTTFVPTSENDLIISSSKTEGLGGLVMGNHDGTDKATVYFYTKSHGASGSRSSVSQYVGTPFGNSPVMVYQFYNSWMYKLGYNGSGDITGWTRVNGGEGLVAFDGYCVISADGEDHFYEMSGDLCSSENVEKELMYGKDNTENMLANSWMAPIRISEFDPENDFTNVEATIYIFNSGSPEDYVTNNGGSSFGSLAGQYSTYTVGTAGDAVIPAMQSFSVYATGADPKITLNHKRLVYDPAVAGTASIIPNKAPQRISAKSEEMELLKLRVSSTSGWGDEVKIYTHEEFSEGFENGWDGRKMEGSSSAPQIYALSSDGNMAINCIPDLEGSQLGFKAGKTDDTYTLSFEYSENAEPLYLLDVTNNAYTRVLNNNSYTFTTRDKIDHTRFVLTHYFAPSITTGVDDTKHEGPKAHKLMIDGILYIIRDGRIYSAEGSLVK